MILKSFKLVRVVIAKLHGGFACVLHDSLLDLSIAISVQSSQQQIVPDDVDAKTHTITTALLPTGVDGDEWII